MENFLKKFSNVPNGFIEDFFEIADERFNDDELMIDFDVVVKWLNVQKGHLKRLLVSHFSERYDYVITTIKKKNENGPGSNYVENIKITPDCFKELCMLSQTAKAKEVRQFYLSIEKLIRKYYKHIEEKLYSKINLLESNQKPKVVVKGGVIYFFEALNYIKISDLENSMYKIGKTTNEEKRFIRYNTENVNNVKPLFILEVDDIHKTEACIKNLLRDFQYRKHKEIYQINMDTLKMVFVNCDKLVSGFKKYIDNNDTKKVDKTFKKMRHSENGLFLAFGPKNARH